MESAEQADDGRFAGTGGTNERGHSSRLGLEADAVQHWLVDLIGKLHIFKTHTALDGRHLFSSIGILILFELRHDFVGSVEAGKGFSQLGADVHYLKDRRDHESEKHVVLKVGADGPGVVQDQMAAEPHDESGDDPENGGRGRPEHAGHGQRLHHVVEQAGNANAEDVSFAILGVIALDDADAAERLSEPAGDLGVDFAAVAEDRANSLEAILQKDDKDGNNGEDRERDRSAAMEQKEEDQGCSDQAADKIYQTGADQVSHAFYIGHDTGDEGSGAVLIVVANGKQAHVTLNLLTHFGDESLAFFRQQLRERERSDGL